MVSAANAEVTTYRATTDDRHRIDGHGYSKSGDTETFIIAAADRNKGQRLTPRVERAFEGKGQIRPNRGVYTFSGTYKIDAASNTTIFQLLKHFPGTADPHRPTCFITVFPSRDGSKWHIHSGNNTDTPLLAAVSKADAFTVKLQSDGIRFHVWINGEHVTSGGLGAAMKSASMRYGAYHHGKGVAKVHVTDAKFQLDSTAKLPDPTSANGNQPRAQSTRRCKNEAITNDRTAEPCAAANGHSAMRSRVAGNRERTVRSTAAAEAVAELDRWAKK